MKGKTILEVVLLVVPLAMLIFGNNIDNSLIVGFLIVLPLFSIILSIKEHQKTHKYALIITAVLLIILGLYSGLLVITHR